MKIRPFFSLIFIIIVSIYVLGCVEKKDTYQTDQESSEISKVITPQQRFSLWNGKDFTGWKLFIPDESVDVSTVWM